MLNKQDFNQNKMRTIPKLVLIALLLSLLTVSVVAQQGGTTSYTYDDNGRLRGVIAPSGEGNIYEYDAAGNITTIRKLPADTVEVFDFSPRIGGPGAQVTIIGTGFGAGVSAVSFNGTAAQIVSVNAPVLVVTVPAGVTTGPISVTAPRGTATSSLLFTVRGISVLPLTATIFTDESQQFTATAILPEDANFVWGVNGVGGGSTTTGTITNAGLYTPPILSSNQTTAGFLIQAISVADPSVIGSVSITVKNRDALRWVGAPILAVRNGSSTPTTITAVPFALPVSVRNGSSTPTTITAVPFALPVSVRNGGTTSSVTGLGYPFSPVVSVTTGPVITSFTINSLPTANLRQGVASTLVLAGKNLTGVTNLQFYSRYDTVDGTITALITNINPAGTELTATITASGSAALGRRFIVLSNGTLYSPRNDTTTNHVEIVP